MTPRTIGPNGAYQISGVIGRGGFATVYRAYHAALDRYVAIKVLRPEVIEPEGALRRFQLEARASARLAGHPNIVTVYDYGEEDGSPYLVLQLVDGTTLEQRLKQPISAQEVERIITSVASALDFAHRRQLIHRDIKPSNVLLDADGTAVLSDFGIAKLLDSTSSLTVNLLGTPEYMSPEQIKGGMLDARSDIYALGIMVYRIFAGRTPFRGNAMAILHQHVNEPVPPMPAGGQTIPAGVEPVVMRALAKDPEDRPASAGEFAAELSRALRPTILVEQARGALGTGDVDRAETLVAELHREHPSFRDLAPLERELAWRRARRAERARVGELVAARRWQQAAAEIDRLDLRRDDDPAVAELVRAVDVGLAEEAAQREREQEALRLREEAARRERQEAERRAREEEARLARETAERRAREEEAQRARDEAARREWEDEARRAREESERLAREEAERRERDEAARAAREEAALQAQAEHDRRAAEPATAVVKPPAGKSEETSTPSGAIPRERQVASLAGPADQTVAPAPAARRFPILIAGLVALALVGVAVTIPLVGPSLLTPTTPTSVAPPVAVAPTTQPTTAPPAPTTAPTAAPKPTSAPAQPTAAPTSPPAAPTPAPTTAPPPPTIAPTAAPTTAPPAPTAAPTVAALPPSVPWRDDVTMLLIPAGPFVMGDDADPSAAPKFTLTLPDYYVDQTEVTNARFASFVGQASYQPRGDWRRFFDAGAFNPAFFDVERGAHPVVNVTWEDAAQYCRWAGKRLPTEAEWEKAARGTDGRRWPWGNEPHPQYANVENEDESREPDTMRVGSLPNGASPYGLLDMVGNAREWTDSPRRSYPLDPTADAGDGAADRVTRGGSWLSLPNSIELTRRLVEPPSVAAKDLGFRCAVSADRAVGR